MTLREYQQRAVNQLYETVRGGSKRPCLVLPTGAGKSHIVAQICRDAVERWPGNRVLVLTHVKEIIEQNYNKLIQAWPNAPVGVYSAGMRMKELGEPITVAGIQSIIKRIDDIETPNVIVIDECHLVGHRDEGSYRTLIAAFESRNQALRVVGLTATPYRLGHGLITDSPAIFDTLIEPVSIEELVIDGYLAPLRSKLADRTIDVSNVHKRRGEFVESELQAAVDTVEQTNTIVNEIVARSEGRKHWLMFCSGVVHSFHVRDALRAKGVTAETITGETSKKERERLLFEFKRGNITAITNANVLTTGFDFPDIDLIAMIRPTLSASLYVQMCGRGMRPKSKTDHCLVLDFAGNVSRHGPITRVVPPKRKGSSKKGEECPTKSCPQCNEIQHASVRTCECCGFEFPKPKPKDLLLHNDDIMGIESSTKPISSWLWEVRTSFHAGIEMFCVTYKSHPNDTGITEYVTVKHDGYAGTKARKLMDLVCYECNIPAIDTRDLHKAADELNACQPPHEIEYKKDGKYNRVLRRVWWRQMEAAL